MAAFYGSLVWHLRLCLVVVSMTSGVCILGCARCLSVHIFDTSSAFTG
jgi:hypothetical protein